MPGTGDWHQPQFDFGEDGMGLPVGGAYGQREVLRYTGLSPRQLDTWVTDRVLVPSICDAKGSGKRRLFSFRDIVALRTLKRLIDTGVSLQKVRCAVQTLRRLGEEDLSSTVLVSDGETVYQCRSADEVLDLVRGGQTVFMVSLGHVLADLRRAGALGDLNARRNRRASRSAEVGQPQAI